MEKDKLREFFLEHKSEFEVDPSINHETKFLTKLVLRVKKIAISLFPYIKKVIIITFIVWAISIVLWWIFDLPTLWQIIRSTINVLFN